MKYQVLFSLKNNEKVFINVVSAEAISALRHKTQAWEEGGGGGSAPPPPNNLRGGPNIPFDPPPSPPPPPPPPQ